MTQFTDDPLGLPLAVVDASARLPESPFRISGTTDICQFNWAIGGRFAAVLSALCDHFGDEAISATVVAPDPETYYRSEYGYDPRFTLRRPEVTEDQLWRRLSFEPDGDPTGAIAFSADVFAIAGSSRGWAVWAQRDWDVALVRSGVEQGPWTHAGIDFLAVDDALSGLVEPDFKTPLSAADRDRFRRLVADGLVAGDV